MKSYIAPKEVEPKPEVLFHTSATSNIGKFEPRKTSICDATEGPALPTDSFSTDPTKGMGRNEWVSKESVTPSQE